MMTDIEQLLPKDNYDALVASVSSPSASNAYATLADIPAPATTIYTGNGTVGSGRVATITDTLTFSGGTTIMTLVSGADTVISGVGTNPIGFGSFGDLNFYGGAGDFDSFTGLFKSGIEPIWQAQIYDNTTFVENASFYATVGDFSGTDRPYAGLYYTLDRVDLIGFEANPFGERILSQSAGLNRLSTLPAASGMAFLSGAGGTGYIGVVDQDGLVDWLGATNFVNIYNDDGALTGNRTVTGAFDINWNNTGDFRRTGDILFAAGANRLLAVEDRTGVGTSYNLTVEAGGGGTSGPNTGGDLILTPGSGGVSGPLVGGQGDIYLTGKNNTTIAKGSNIYVTAGNSAGNGVGAGVFVTTGNHTGVGGTGGDMVITLGTGTVSDGTFEITGSFGSCFLVDGGTGKVTIPGLLDPIGLKMTPVAANPGASETLWSDSGDSNRPYWDGNKLAFYSELIADTTIYSNDGTVGAGRTATLTDTITWTGGSTIFRGAGTDETSNIIELQDSGSVQRLRFTDDARMKVQFSGPIDAGVAARNHVIQWDADVTERTGGDGYSAYQFTSSFAGANVSNHFRTLYASAPSGGADPSSGRYAIYGDGYVSGSHGVGVYGRAGDNGSGTTHEFGGWFQLIGGLATSQNYGVYSLLQNNASGSLTAESKAFYGLNTSSQATVTGDMYGGHFWANRGGGAIGNGTNIGIRAAASGAGTNIAMQVLANQGVLVFGTTNPFANTMMTMRGLGTDSTTFTASFAKSNGVNNFQVRDDGVCLFNASPANPIGTQSVIMAGTVTSDATGLENGISMLYRHDPTVDGSGRPTLAYFRAFKQSAFNSLGITGIVGEAYNSSTGDMTNASIGGVGILGQFRNTADDTIIQRGFGLDANAQTSSTATNDATIVSMGALSLRMDQTENVNVTHWQYMYAKAPTNITNANVTNSYILRADAATAIGATNEYGFYIAGASSSNRLAGDLVVGSLTQSAARSTLEVNGNAEVIGSANGVICESPDGTRWQAKIDNSGSWTFVALP